jgi:hypothetical protein
MPAFMELTPVVIEFAGLTAGVLVSLFTAYNVTREVFIRGNLDTGNVPLTCCILI